MPQSNLPVEEKRQRREEESDAETIYEPVEVVKVVPDLPYINTFPDEKQQHQQQEQEPEIEKDVDTNSSSSSSSNSSSDDEEEISESIYETPKKIIQVQSEISTSTSEDEKYSQTS